MTVNAVQLPAAGLVSGPDRVPVPLRSVRVRAVIESVASRVELAQTWRNEEPVPIEAVYVFPLPEAAAVSSLELRIGERVVRGRVMEREEAFATYDEALLDGHFAALLDEERPNVFTASIGRLLPGEEVALVLTWVAELEREGEALRFVLPTTVAPRYAPAEDARGVSPTPAERVSPPVTDRAWYGFSFEAEVDVPGGLLAVESPSHPVRIEVREGGGVAVALASPVAAMDRDLVLRLTPRAAQRPWAALEVSPDGTATAALYFLPALGGERAPQEVTFLVDRSGSMGGQSIGEVRRALQLCLRSLRPGDSFDIVGFGSTFESLFGEARPYDDATLQQASAHVRTLAADLGGTEILPALATVLARTPSAGLARQVVLMTDGEVSNDDAVIALARGEAGRCRIFTFGIGHGASEHLVRAVARVSGGAAEFVTPGEALEAKVLRQFARLGRAAVSDLRLDWGGLPLTWQAPHHVPAVFDGERVAVYAALARPASGTVALAGRVGGRDVRWEVPVTDAAARPGTLLATLAARAAIRDLEEGRSHLHAGGSGQRGRRDERVKEAIVRLAVAHGLASRETSFVAVEERDGDGEVAPAEVRRVPVTLAFGWGGRDMDLAGIWERHPTLWAFNRVEPRELSAAEIAERLAAARAAFGSPPAAAASEPSNLVACYDSMPVVYTSAPDGAGAAGAAARTMPPAAPRTRHQASGWVPSRRGGDGESPFQPRRPVPRHDAVVGLQRADGSWYLDRELARAVGADLAVLREAAALLRPRRIGPMLLATAVALAWLRTRAAARRDEWRMIAEKAEVWIGAALASCRDLTREELDAMAESLVK